MRKQAPLTMDRLARGPRMRPEDILASYDDAEWELFIEDWLSVLGGRYQSVQRFGGSGDRGVDVAGFTDRRGFEGVWDSYQGKHYGRSIGPSIAWPEILKVFLLPVETPTYRLPRQYVFLAPHGVTTSLAHLLRSPDRMRIEFLKQLDTPNSAPFRALSTDVMTSVRALAGCTDFSMFAAIEARVLVDDMRASPVFAQRFGGPLPERNRDWVVPDDIVPTEMRYVGALVEIYRERYADPSISAFTCLGDDRMKTHLARQRESFFRAESLRRFARDSVSPGTFEGLQSEIYDSVIDVVEGPHADGMERLRATLLAAVQAQLTSNALLTVAESADRQGMCHQLANEERLQWIR